ncbi:MAG: hypothetical protein V1709_06355, partial [Planctomycetota bacterium]
MSIKNIILSIPYLLFVLVIYSQTNNTKNINSEIIIKVESPLLVFLESDNIDEPLIISGTSNLPKDTIIRINISGKITSLEGGRFEL